MNETHNCLKLLFYDTAHEFSFIDKIFLVLILITIDKNNEYFNICVI